MVGNKDSHSLTTGQEKYTCDPIYNHGIIMILCYQCKGFISRILRFIELIHVVNVSLDLSLNDDHQILKYQSLD